MYEDLVEEILLYFSTGKPPVKPDVIAYGLGLEVISSPLPQKVAGFLYLGKNLQAIIVNESHPLVRQRFTIAHELGHFFLHQKSSFLIEKERDILDLEADNFAGTLLLPYFLLERYLTLPSSKISRIFMVSQETLRKRLEILKRENRL